VTKINAFLKLIRWGNVLIIALTQCLFFYCIKLPLYQPLDIANADRQFLFLLAAYACISAAGYIINDYFDLNIDQINKPQKVIINRFIPRRWALFLHVGLSILGIFLCASVNIENCLLAFASVIVLFGYSASFKKKFLIGNVLVAFYLAWIVAITAYFDFRSMLLHKIFSGKNFDILFNTALIFVAFSFIINLIREIIKDMEDVEGDRKYGCKTMPIVWGINPSKVFVAVWLIVLIVMLITVQVYAVRLHWWWTIAYEFILVLLPIIWIFKQLFSTQTPEDFHKLSSAIKWVMLTGVLSMGLFKLYL
jgi:4-hydroxybenzoate polyprenyltransferase